MKIVFINKYQNKVARGAETYVFELSRRLSKKHEVSVKTSVEIMDLFRNKYDIAVPTNGRIQPFLVRLITWITGGKMIISGQSGAGLDDRINLYAFPDVFVALSEHQKKWARKINPFVKVVKIPNGTNLPSLKSSNRTAGKKNTILSVGAFSESKRHELTIEAVSLMDKKARLIIAGGGGSNRKNIEEMGRKRLGKERFEIISVPYEKMDMVYKQADVLAFPSVPWESFGIVIVEALARGLPVVATDDPIRREIVGNAGILVDPNDSEKYSKALEKALTTDWGELPRIQSEKFTWDDISEKYENIFENLVQK
jgi:glycosyltransferase involved in cell wall biosynthesis